MRPETVEDLRERNRDLQIRLEKAEATLRAIGNGETAAVVTERKRALQHSEALYRGIARNLPNGMVCLVDPEMRCICIEGELASKLGLNSDQLQGRQVLEALEAVDEGLRSVVEARFRRTLAGQTASYETEVRGRLAWSHYAPLWEENGTVWAALMVALDVTERRRAEERLRHTQKLESVGMLAGGIAHDFNNLLACIMGNASMLLDEVAPATAERLKDVISSAEKGANLTRQLLAYSGKGQFIVRDLDVSQAVHEVTALVEVSIPRSVQLVVHVERRLPMVRMDPSQLQQVVMNLVINAGEAIGEGKQGKITVATSLVDVEKSFVDAIGEDVAQGRYVCIEVSDTGSGIDDETKSKIFDPFFTTRFIGRGLGLPAVSGILRSLKGGLTLDSAPGRGSTFRVFLPGGERHERETYVPDGLATILVVDDETPVRDFISEILRRNKYRVLLAADGREALEVCKREPGDIDAAVLDIAMPIMGANELLPKITARKPNIKIMLTSGYCESEARRLCAARPGVAFIQKPFTAQRFVKAVDELFGLKR
jgi:PAS domain S-box-containing protein